MVTTEQIKPGARFVHAHQLVEVKGMPVREWPHMECVITAVRRGTVYYRNTTGFLSHMPIDRFPATVQEWLS